jgi:hypothetical protein
MIEESTEIALATPSTCPAPLGMQPVVVASCARRF